MMLGYINHAGRTRKKKHFEFIAATNNVVYDRSDSVMYVNLGTEFTEYIYIKSVPRERIAFLQWVTPDSDCKEVTEGTNITPSIKVQNNYSVSKNVTVTFKVCDVSSCTGSCASMTLIGTGSYNGLAAGASAVITCSNSFTVGSAGTYHLISAECSSS